MKYSTKLGFQIAAVFIGTIVGAGLASGQEIKQFFTYYGYKSFFGILICCILYIIISKMIIEISIDYDLRSYSALIKLVSPGVFGKKFGDILSKATNIITGAFIICCAAIILAGSGALINQFSGVSKLVGVFIMLSISLIVLLRNTKGLIEINSLIVPCLIIVIITLFLLNLIFYRDVLTVQYIKNIPYSKNTWLTSTFLYAGYNIFGCMGVLVPLSAELKNQKSLFWGIFIGAIGLTLLCFMINLMLLVNTPYIFHYEIPLLYISNRFGNLIQLLLLCIIWLEMFSTEVSDIYSLAKTLEQSFKLSYNKAIIMVLIIAVPISQIGFVNLISTLYPVFGVISFMFVVQFVVFYYKDKLGFFK